MAESAVETFGLSQIAQSAVPVTDIERTIPFYRDTLGMRFLFQVPPGLAFFELNGVRLMLDGPAKAQAGNSSVIYLQSLGSPGSIYTFFRDPDKNLLALMSEVRQ